MTTLTSSTPGCFRDTQGFTCFYITILGDNEPVPLQPNLKNSDSGNNDIVKFLIWPSNTERPYMTFEFGSAQSVTAINIEFLNYPAQGFSLPNLELYSTASSLITVPSDLNAQCIEFELQNNSILSQDDCQVTNVSLIFSSTSRSLLLRWNYTGVYNLNFFMVSEVDFCSDNQQPGDTQITFQDPQSDKYTIDSSDSSRNAVLISNGSSVPGLQSALTINQLRTEDEGTYTCMVDGNLATIQLTVVAGSAPLVTSPSEFKD